MDVTKAVRERRAFRSLLPADISGELIQDLAGHARLAPSCFNNQPVRFVFVRDRAIREALRPALSDGNRWAHDASLIVAVFSRKEDDCVIRDREYHQFDCGLASAFLILRATELGLVAHPIAGFSPKKAGEILGIPGEYRVITLIVCGRRNPELSPVLSEKQKAWELKRPERLPVDEIAFLDRYGKSGRA